MVIDFKTLKERFETLRRLDSQFRVFGACKHRYRLRPPAVDQTLREFELLHSVKLPNDYRQYLSEISNGGAGPNYGLMEIERAGIGEVPSRPFSTNNTTAQSRGLVNKNGSHGCIWLSDNGCASYDVMVVNGAPHGSVWRIGDDESRDLVYDSFQDWYLGWLQSAIQTIENERLLVGLKAGMHLDEIRGLFGSEIVPISDDSRNKAFGIAFYDCNAHFLFGPDRKLVRVQHHSHQISPQSSRRPNSPR